uniref:Cingulin n=1 Tax=Varanus komodoensis TaxID=61221 RepID=A0A8D2KT57_VARKO
MEYHVNGALAEKHSPMDYGVQIRFINDLKEPSKPQKIRSKASKPGSYGVAVRVQGIDGQPFVVLNSGEKGEDSFGVQIKGETKDASGSISSDSDLPDNPYGAQLSRYSSQYNISDEEPGRSSRSNGPSPGGDASEQPAGAPRSTSMMNLADPSQPSPPGGGGDIDTMPLSSVDSLISKFDGKAQQRGRATRRSRISAAERKRSQSLDGRVAFRDTAECREPGAGERPGSFREEARTPATVQLGSAGPAGGRSLSRHLSRVCSSVTALTRPVPQSSHLRGGFLQLKSTPDLLKDQQEMSQPGSSDYTKELIYSILKDGVSVSSVSGCILALRTLRMSVSLSSPHPALCKTTQLCENLGLSQDSRRNGAPRGLEIRLEESEEECRRLREAFAKKSQEHQSGLQEHSRASASPRCLSLLQELMEAREELEEVLRAKQKQEEQLRQRERELTALKGALKEEVASHDQELDRVRQQYQQDMEQLRRNMEDVSQDQASLEAERQKINSVVRNLQRELQESNEEVAHWKELFQKNKEELRGTKQEDLTLEKQAQDEVLRQRERELLSLKEALEDEVASRDQEAEELKQQFQQNMQRLQKECEEVKAALEGEKEATEQTKKAVESTLRETQEENDDLRRKILGLESQLKEFRHFADNWQEVETRLKEKIAKLEADRKQMEDSLGNATDQEQELLLAKRSLESRLEEAQRSLSRLSREHQDLSASYHEELKQKEQLKRAKSELEEQKQLLDKSIGKLTKELDKMSAESHNALSELQSQLEEYKEKSRREITDSQKQAKDRNAEVEKMQYNLGRLQDEVTRLKQALQDTQAERENAIFDKELLAQRLNNLQQEMESKRRSQEDRSRQAKSLEVCVLSRLEVELEEEKNTVELLTERINRTRDQIDQLRAELLQERSIRQDLECDKVSLERQNKDLKSRLTSSEGLQKPSANVSQLESHIQDLQDKLQAEEREKSILVSSNRKLERKVKELTIQIDDERQHVNDQKDQLSLRVKALKRQVDTAEEEIERLEAARKKALRELEEQHETNEQLQGRIKALEKDLWRKTTRTTAESSLNDDHLSSDEEFDSAYGPSSITSLLTEGNLQASSC